MRIRVGFGYDVHQLVKDRDLWLGGIRIDHELGLLGFHFGNKVYANLEIGVGSEYYGLKGGIGYWF